MTNVKLSCLICNENQNSVGALNMLDYNSWKEDSSTQVVSGELSVVFVVRNLLGISSEFCEYLIYAHGNPSEWGLSFCSMCQRVIQEAQFISERIRKLVTDYDELAKKLKKVTLTSFGEEAAVSETSEDLTGKRRIAAEIRSWFYEDSNENGSMRTQTETTSRILPSLVENDSEIWNEMDCTGTEEDKNEDDEREYHFVNGMVPCPKKCGKKSKTVFLAKVHFNRRHKGDLNPFHCDICKAKFARPSRLAIHKKKKHSGANKSKKKVRSRGLAVKNILIKNIRTISKPTEPQPQPEPVNEIGDVAIVSDVSFEFQSRPRTRLKKKAEKITSYIKSEPEFSDTSDSDQADEPENPMSPQSPEWGSGPEYEPSDSEDEDNEASQTEKQVGDEALGNELIDQNKCLKSPSKGPKVKVKLDSRYINKCPDCPISFREQYLLDAHILRKHYGVRLPFACDLCDKKFKILANLQVHQSRFHKNISASFRLTNPNDESLDFEASNHVQQDKNGVNSAEYAQKNEVSMPLEGIAYNLEIEEDSELLKAMEEGGKIPCEQCNLKLKSMLHLKGHINVKHLGIKKGFECPRCHRTFRMYNNLFYHCQRHLSKSVFLKCTHSGCKKGFYSKMRRDAHIQKFHLGIKKSLKCSKCGKGFSYTGSLYFHMREKHGIYLNEQNDGEGGLKDHKASSATKLPLVFKCSNCQLRFPSKLSVAAHSRRVHPDMKYSVPCTLCQQKFSTEDNLRNHVLNSHPSKQKRGAKQIIICEDCGKHYASQASLTIHRRIHTKEKAFMCEICSKSFSLERYLEYHQQAEHHVELGLSPNKCPYCNKILNNPRNLETHIKLVHKKDFKFKCPSCPVGTMFKRQMDLHIRQHTGEKPLQCPHCPKSFSRKKYLTDHIRIHTGEKPWNCHICPKPFSDKPTYQRHMETHGDTTHTCSVCARTFKVWHAYRLHMKTHGQNVRIRTAPIVIKDHDQESGSEKSVTVESESESNLDQGHPQEPAPEPIAASTSKSVSPATAPLGQTTASTLTQSETATQLQAPQNAPGNEWPSLFCPSMFD